MRSCGGAQKLYTPILGGDERARQSGGGACRPRSKHRCQEFRESESICAPTCCWRRGRPASRRVVQGNKTALHVAAFNGCAKTVLALIRVGASLDAADNVSSRCNTPVWVRTVPVTITVRYRAQNKQTALQCATYKSQARVVTALARLDALDKVRHAAACRRPNPGTCRPSPPSPPHHHRSHRPAEPSHAPSICGAARPFQDRAGAVGGRGTVERAGHGTCAGSAATGHCGR